MGRRRVDGSTFEVAHDRLEVALLNLEDPFGDPEVPPLGDEGIDVRASKEERSCPATSEAPETPGAVSRTRE